MFVALLSNLGAAPSGGGGGSADTSFIAAFKENPTFLSINLVVSAIVSQFFPEPQNTPFQEILRSSLAARIAIGLFAVLTAPLVEEVVYRGVMYPALARKMGRIAAILAVSALFLLVHADQYAGAPAIMVPLGTLSLALTILRAYSGSLLPSFALHLVFNGFQVILILITGGGPPPSQ